MRVCASAGEQDSGRGETDQRDGGDDPPRGAEAGERRPSWSGVRAQMATRIATPSAKPVWRMMLTTAEPVANDRGGSSEDAVAINVGNVRPTPTPVRTMPAATPLQ